MPFSVQHAVDLMYVCANVKGLVTDSAAQLASVARGVDAVV